MLSQFFDKGIVTRIYSHLCFFLDTSLFILSKFKVYDPSQFLCIVGGRGQVNVLFTHIDNSSSTIHFKDDTILEVGKKELFFLVLTFFILQHDLMYIHNEIITIINLINISSHIVLFFCV